MASVAYNQGRKAYNDATGMKNPYTHMIHNRYDKRDTMQQALVRSESDWNRGNDEARRANESRLKKYK